MRSCSNSKKNFKQRWTLYCRSISAIQEGNESLEQYKDVHIDTKNCLKGLIPDDEGNRLRIPKLNDSFYLHITESNLQSMKC